MWPFIRVIIDKRKPRARVRVSCYAVDVDCRIKRLTGGFDITIITLLSEAINKQTAKYAGEMTLDTRERWRRKFSKSGLINYTNLSGENTGSREIQRRGVNKEEKRNTRRERKKNCVDIIAHRGDWTG